MKNSKKFVEPRPPSLRASILQRLGGVPEPIRAIVADALERYGVVKHDADLDSDELKYLFYRLKEERDKPKDQDEWLTWVVLNGTGSCVNRVEWRAMSLALAREVDLAKGILKCPKLNYVQYTHVLSLLIDKDFAPILEPYFDIEQLKALRPEPQRHAIWGFPQSIADIHKEVANLRSPIAWCLWRGDYVWEQIRSSILEADETVAAELIRGYLTALCICNSAYHLRPNQKPDLKVRVLELLDAVERRVGDDIRRLSNELRRQYILVWAYAYLMLGDFDGDIESDPRVSRVKLAAQTELARLREICLAANQPESEAAFRERLSFMSAAAGILFAYAPLWDGMRPLLLLFRALNMPCVHPDLRWWSTIEEDKQANSLNLWMQVPSLMATEFHFHAKREQKNDEQLISLRTSMARFFLDRLKTVKSGSGPTEPDPTWREAYIRAVSELYVNPGGTGHHTLHFAAKNDPDENVRAKAQDAYVLMRHNPKLPDDYSPRRAVFRAFWWLRQAHLHVMGIEIDESGAQATRENEVRRTTDQTPEQMNRELEDHVKFQNRELGLN